MQISGNGVRPLPDGEALRRRARYAILACGVKAPDTTVEEQPIIAIVGPTATGKTSTAVHVALTIGGEIISADSMAVYRGMDIGTAKPTAEERAAVPFHLIDVVEPDQP
ncbi:MAG TPA: isopentenyl transferase family protein, partial [Chthonomonadales bacterium]|nr:isopentenyl transferase family protein [Chthonomonadales bacterium]